MSYMSNKHSFCSFLSTSQRNGRKKKTKKHHGVSPRRGSFVTSTLRVTSVSKKTRATQRVNVTQPKGLSAPRVLPEAKITEKRRIDAQKCNIFHIDSIIRDQLNSQISTVNELERDLKNALWILLNGSPKDQVMAKEQSSMLRRQIQDLETTFALSFYILRTADILEEYRKIMLSKNSRSFVCLDHEAADREAVKRDELVIKYLLVAREYVEIENYRQHTKKLMCPACYNTDLRRASDSDTAFVCSKCTTEVQILDDTPSFKDTDRVNMCSRYTYSRKGHFIDAIKKLQGKQNTDPEVIQSVINVLLNAMEFHNLRSDTVTKQHLYMFLAEKNLSAHYENLNLLHRIITDKPCPDISAYEQKLLKDYDKQESALDKVYVNDTRKNSLNVYYKLYKLLQYNGYNCRKDDFCLLKTKTKEDEHDEKMKRAWSILGWKWIETF